jgi:hypothetical protein
MPLSNAYDPAIGAATAFYHLIDDVHHGHQVVRSESKVVTNRPAPSDQCADAVCPLCAGVLRPRVVVPGRRTVNQDALESPEGQHTLYGALGREPTTLFRRSDL